MKKNRIGELLSRFHHMGLIVYVVSANGTKWPVV